MKKLHIKLKWLKHEPIKLISFILLEWWPDDGMFYFFDIMILRFNIVLWVE